MMVKCLDTNNLKHNLEHFFRWPSKTIDNLFLVSNNLEPWKIFWETQKTAFLI